MKSGEALESNNIMIGYPNKKNVPARTSSPARISLTVVKLGWPTLRDGARIITFCGLLGGDGALGEWHDEAGDTLE
jgi:hypothetical protein